MSKHATQIIPINRLAPPDRGPLVDAAAIARMIGGVKPPSEKWVRMNVPGKIALSYNIVRWYQRDVADWIAERARQGMAS